MTKNEAIKVLNGSINWDSVPTAKIAWQTLVDYCTQPTAHNISVMPCLCDSCGVGVCPYNDFLRAIECNYYKARA